MNNGNTNGSILINNLTTDPDLGLSNGGTDSLVQSSVVGNEVSLDNSDDSSSIQNSKSAVSSTPLPEQPEEKQELLSMPTFVW